jgi:integrase
MKSSTASVSSSDSIPKTHAQWARNIVQHGDDPIEVRKADQEAKIQAAIKEKASTMSFAACVDAYLAEKLGTLKNAKSAAQWRETLGRAIKAFGPMNVSAIDTPTVIKLLTPIWKATPETASRLRSRIEKVLGWAGTHNFRPKEIPNPAAWKGNLEHVFTTKREVKHHKAMPFKDLPAYMVTLRNNDSISARALEFTILTVLRTSEVLGARWGEIDPDAKTWTVPACRMKLKKEHIVPLSNAAVALLSGLKSNRDPDSYVFPGANEGKPLSNMAMLQLMRGTAGNGYTVHGTVRSGLRDWAGEETDHEHETIEFALAHVIPNKTEAAYRRYRALGKRTRLMEDWANYLGKITTAESTNVVKLHG